VRFDIEKAEGWDMGNYRTLLLKYNLLRLPPDVAEKISDFLKIQEQYRRWASEWVNGGSLPPERMLRRFARKLLYAAKASKWLGGLKKNGIKVGKMQPPLIFDAQLRLNNERDVSSGVFVDLPRRELKIRRWSNRRGNTIILPIDKHAIKWIQRRVQEGGKLALAAVWIGRSRSSVVKLYVALIFRRNLAPVQPKRLLVIDFNALHNGVSWAVVEGEKIVTKGVLRPDTSKILHLQNTVTRLDSLCANKDVMCDAAMATKSRVWRVLRVWEDEAAKKLMRLALQYKAAIVVDLPRGESIRKLKEGSYTSEKKIFLNFGRLWERLRGLAGWYGIPYREARLYSSICPRCERKMSILQNRRVKCACGFEANRDEVPFHWAIKLFPKLIFFSNSPFSWEARGARRCGPRIQRGPPSRGEPAAGRGSQPADVRRRLLCRCVKLLASSSSAEFI